MINEKISSENPKNYGRATFDNYGNILVNPIGKFGFVVYPLDDLNAVSITIEQLEALEREELYWEGNYLLPYAKTADEIVKEQNEARIAELNKIIREAKLWLENHDYIASKVSAAVLMNDEATLNALRVEYADTLLEAQQKRDLINNCEIELSLLR